MNRRVLIRTVCLVLLVTLFPDQGNGQSKTLTIGYPSEKNDFHDAIAETIATAYQRLGIKVLYKAFPAERSLVMSNQGMSDGELARIAGLQTKYPNLVQVPFNHATVEQMAYSTKKDILVSGWKSLAPYKIAFDKGFKVAERNTVGMNVHLVSSHAAAFRMVKNGRMDVAIANRFTGNRILRDPKFGSIIMLEPPLQASKLYHYIHVSRAHLVDRVVEVLNQMKDNGDIDAIRARFNLPEAD